jgi:Domain of unknown function (DUF4136)
MKRTFLWVVFSALGAASVLLAAKTIVDYNHSADFSRYKTYSWLEVKAGDPLWTDRIREAVDFELTAKGWTKVAVGGDAAIAAFGSSHTQPRIETFYDGFGGGWYWRGFGPGIATTTVEEAPIGTLVIDIFDMQSKKLIWRAKASDALSDKPEKNEKKLERAVAEMFKHFPPRVNRPEG